jgi:hypothetical protein
MAESWRWFLVGFLYAYFLDIHNFSCRGGEFNVYFWAV